MDKQKSLSYQRSEASAEPFTCASRASEFARRSVAADSNPAAPVRALPATDGRAGTDGAAQTSSGLKPGRGAPKETDLLGE